MTYTQELEREIAHYEKMIAGHKAMPYDTSALVDGLEKRLQELKAELKGE